MLDCRDCWSCEAPEARLRCSSCRAARYCDRQCQRAHWAVHKGRCGRRLCDAGHTEGCCGWTGWDTSTFRVQSMKLYMVDDGFPSFRSGEKDDVLLRHMRALGVAPRLRPGSAVVTAAELRAMGVQHDADMSAHSLWLYTALRTSEADLVRTRGGFCPLLHYLRLFAPLVMTVDEWKNLID
eukprot:jgi/Tetstr1/454293/TSEL_041212.t1